MSSSSSSKKSASPAEGAIDEEAGALLGDASPTHHRRSDSSSLPSSPPHRSASALHDTTTTTTNGELKNVPFKTFGILVCVYVAPLAYALGAEGVYHHKSSGRPLPAYLSTTPSLGAICLWLLLNAASYCVQRRLACTLGWKMHEKMSATHKEDLFRMAYLSGLFCFAGRVGARLDSHPLDFSLLLVLYVFAFGLLFEMVRHCNIEFTRDCVKNSYTLGFACFVVVVLAALAVNHFSLVVALAGDELLATLGLCALVLALHALLSAAPGRSSAHWHHWWTGALGALFCPFDSLASKIAQAMLLGIYLHGAALFGVEPCFTPDDPLIPTERT